MKKKNNIKQDQPGFLNYVILNMLGAIILCCGGCPVHCKMFTASVARTPYLPVAAPPPCSHAQVVPTEIVVIATGSWCVTLPTGNLKSSGLDYESVGFPHFFI